MTGAIVSYGADCVIRFEDTDEPSGKNGPNLNNPQQVKIFKTADGGDNIRPAGGIAKKGDLIIPAGTLIGPNHILALASLGIAQIKVVRRPTITEKDGQTEKQIRDYFKSSAIDGIHTSQNDTGEGMLLWQSGARP